MDDSTYYEIRGGAVRKIVKTVQSTVPLTDFFSKLADQAPKTIKTPPLPADVARYCKVPAGGTFYDVYSVYSKPLVVTVAWKDKDSARAKEEHFTVAFPGLLFKFAFDARGVMSEPRVKVCKTRPTRDQERLSLASLPNCWEDGRICMTPQVVPGDNAASCTGTIQSFYTGQAFNNDLRLWPPGTRGFADWQSKTNDNPRWIESARWKYEVTFGEWSTRLD